MKIAYMLGAFQVPDDFTGTVTEMFEILLQHRKDRDLDEKDKTATVSESDILTPDISAGITEAYKVLGARIITKQQDDPDFKSCFFVGFSSNEAE